MNVAEVNIDCLRAAEHLLRGHDMLITQAADALKQLRKDRGPLAERVQHCIDILCGRATPDLFTAPTAETAAIPLPVVESPADYSQPTPPLAPGEWVDVETVRAAKLGDIAAVQTPDLEPIADWLMNDTETETVGDLWDWIDEDFGGMRHAGITAMMRKLAPKEYAKHAQAFADVVMGFIANNGHGPAEKVDDDSPADTTAPGPLVCKPVGEGLLRDIPGVTAEDADKLDAKAIRTLADLEQRCNGDASNSSIYRVLVVPKGPLSGPDADRVANAVTAHLKPATVPAPDPEPEPVEPFDPTLVEDLTAEEEARVGAKPTKSPGDLRKLAAMAEWRKRQAAGDTIPTWGMWAEFQVYLTDGRMVAVVYDPGDGGVEFHGEATSESGYHLEYSRGTGGGGGGGKSPRKPLEAWAKDKADELAREVKKGKAKSAKEKLKAPPKKGKVKGSK